jgi:hypothetical protein
MSPQEYLEKTSSAVKHLFAGIHAYIQVFKAAPFPVLVFVQGTPEEEAARVAAWEIEKAAEIEAQQQALRKFVAESFALNALCGAVLQIAQKGLEICSTNKTVNAGWETIPKSWIRCCVGREIHGVPQGIIVQAARNQFAHFNDPSPLKPTVAVFDALAKGDTCLSLTESNIIRMATNVTGVMGWRDFEVYQRDMRSMLNLEGTD